MMDELKRLQELTEVLTGNGYLRDQAEEWEYALDAIPEFVYVINPNHDLKFVNKALARRLGVRKSDLYNKKCFKVIKNKEVAETDACDFPADCCDLERDHKMNGEVYLENLGGWFLYDRSPIYTKTNKLIGFICILRDITEKKALEKETLHRQQMLDTIYNTAPICLGLLSKSTRYIITANDAMSRLLGYSRDELEGQSARIVYPSEEIYNSVGREKHSQIDKVGTGVVETTWQTKSGELLDILLTSSVTGHPDELVFTAMDVTEVHAQREAIIEAECALRESEDRYRQIFDVAPAGIYEMDYSTGNFSNVNAYVCKHTGYTAEELLSMSAFDLLTEEGKQLFADRLATVAKGKPISDEVEYEMIRKDGSTIWLSLTNNYTYGSDGSIKGATVVARDITERRRMKHNIKSELKTFISKVDKSKRVLIVEDQRTTSELIAEYLERFDFEPVIANDGQSAVDLIEANGICLVIVDLVLPAGPTGIDVIEKMANRHPSVPIIVLSGTADVEDIEHAMRAGAWDYLAKPVSMENLKSVVNKNLEQSILIKKSKLLDEFLELTN